MTKSINRLTSSCYGIFIIYVILGYNIEAHSSPPSCGLYGAPPCQFLPAPPGHTPSCARPGKTYCEYIDNYPTYLIKNLVKKWGYDAPHLLIDETWEDFAAVAWHDTPVFYDPKSIFPQRDYNHGNGQDFNGYSYQTPFGGVSGGGGRNRGSVTAAASSNSLFITNPTTEGPSYLLYTSSGNKQTPTGAAVANSSGRPATGQLIYNNSAGGKSTPYNATLWLKRLIRDVSNKQKPTDKDEHKDVMAEKDGIGEEKEGNSRDVSLNMDLLDIVGGIDTTKQQAKRLGPRTKRQSPGRTTLCQTTTQFITPQAALNSRGNWMFVVNEQNTARQMVKAELCASNTCSNLCELPNGYNSRCEQKFVQKRLIALQGNGQNLYTDTFWFPSCCVCTIAAN